MAQPKLDFTQGQLRNHRFAPETAMSAPYRFDRRRRWSFSALALVIWSVVIGSAAALAALIP